MIRSCVWDKSWTINHSQIPPWLFIETFLSSTHKFPHVCFISTPSASPQPLPHHKSHPPIYHRYNIKYFYKCSLLHISNDARYSPCVCVYVCSPHQESEWQLPWEHQWQHAGGAGQTGASVSTTPLTDGAKWLLCVPGLCSRMCVFLVN